MALVAGYRTPFCKAGTEFAKLTARELGTAVVQELVTRSEIEPQEIDALVYGNVVPTVAAPNVAREILLSTSLPRSIHATTVMRACASSTEALTSAGNAIALGYSDCAIVGGVDCLSDVPILFSRRFSDCLVAASRAKSLAERLRCFAAIRPKDLLPVPPALAERSTGLTMGQHAEAMAKENDISRRAQDELAFKSHMNAAQGIADGRLPPEIVPVPLPREKRAVTKDNHIRPDTTLEALAQLKPAFDKRYGSVTAGNACPVTDGASAMLIMSEDKARALGYAPLGYIRSYAYAAVDPSWQLLIGPVFAIAQALDQAGLSLGEMDLIDLHEAFAAQVLSVTKALGSRSFAVEKMGRSEPVGEVDPAKLNVLGGSIAIGHPFAATACRQVTTVLHELQRRGRQYGLIAQCAAGAMGAALIVERE